MYRTKTEAFFRLDSESTSDGTPSSASVFPTMISSSEYTAMTKRPSAPGNDSTSPYDGDLPPLLVTATVMT